MPVYHFYCEDGHETERLFGLSDRPDDIACATCGKKATRALRASPSEAEEQENDTTLRNYAFRCNACGHRFEDVVPCTQRNDVPCEKCGAPTTLLVNVQTDRFSQNLYPYFDRGLGMVLESKAHRARVCKERGLIPVDGDYDVGRDLGVDAERKQAAEEIAAHDEYMDEVENAPWFAGYRQARDAGQFDDVKKKAAGG